MPVNRFSIMSSQALLYVGSDYHLDAYRITSTKVNQLVEYCLCSLQHIYRVYRYRDCQLLSNSQPQLCGEIVGIAVDPTDNNGVVYYWLNEKGIVTIYKLPYG